MIKRTPSLRRCLTAFTCLAFILVVDVHVRAFSSLRFGGGGGRPTGTSTRSLTGAILYLENVHSRAAGDCYTEDVDPISCENIDESCSVVTSRRAAMRNIVATSSAGAIMMASFSEPGTPPPAVAYPGETITNTEVDLDCLKDLPPVARDSIRIYFCRHGQTENNRLRIVQGARVDPPINTNGIAQATNLGLALARCDPKPALFFSSSLQRARMTAEIAAKNANANANANAAPKALSSLAEIDFGPVADGQPISAVQDKMKESYAKWALGDVDYRPDGGGDNGREVLTRARDALETLVREANEASVSCVVAVTHSAYLRVLVGLASNEPLVRSGLRKIRNGSVTVVDVPRDLNLRKLGSKPTLLGGWLSRTPPDFALSVPSCSVVRINETRHLPLDTV